MSGACTRRSQDLPAYCEHCDLLVGLEGLHVTDVSRDEAGGLTVTVETAPKRGGCPGCG